MVVNFHVAVFLPDEAPDFVGLNPLASQIAHTGAHERYAALASKHEQPENRVAVQLRDALNCADAGALDKKLNRQQRLIFRHRHGSEQPLVLFRVRLAALHAAEALKAIAVLAALLAFTIAR